MNQDSKQCDIKNADDENAVAYAYYERALENLYRNSEEALADSNRCIEIWERLRDAGKLQDENDLNMAYMNRGDIYNTMKEYVKAAEYYDRCIEIWEGLQGTGDKDFNETALAFAYYKRRMLENSIDGQSEITEIEDAML